MEYRTVFDIATVGYKSWGFPAFGLIFVVIGFVLVANRKRLPGIGSQRSRSTFTFAFFGFAVAWTLIVFFSTYRQYSSLSYAEASSHVSIAEGVVTNFKPMPVAGRTMEKFCVSGTCFEYSDYVIVGGFNNTSSHGGPLREGLPVRVTFVGSSIVKLEIGKS